MKKIFISILLSVFCLFLSAEDISSFFLLSHSPLISDSGNNPLLLEEGDDWFMIGMADLSEPRRLAGFDASEYNYRIRFKVMLSKESPSELSTLQLKFLNNQEISLYHIPLDDAKRTERNFYSNWYLPSESFSRYDWKGPAFARILSPPGRERLLNLYQIELELWGEPKEDKEESSSVVLADGGSFFEWTGLSKKLPQQNNEQDVLTKAEALTFSLNVVDTIIQGNLPAFYSALADRVYSLNTGNNYSCYRIPPPEGVNGEYSIKNYMEDYQYSLYSYQDFITLFPQWAESDRNWNPDEQTYLFMGNQLKNPSQESLLSQDNLLVFMVAPKDGDIKIIARPEF